MKRSNRKGRYCVVLRQSGAGGPSATRQTSDMELLCGGRSGTLAGADAGGAHGAADATHGPQRGRREAAHQEPHDSFIDDRWNPEATALRGELIELISRALLQLPPEQRLAVVLSDVQGLAYDEIAEVMQTSLGTVKSRIARGRSHLRDLLRTHPELLPSTYRRASEMG